MHDGGYVKWEPEFVRKLSVDEGVHGLRMELALRVLRREVQHLRRESEGSVIDTMDFR